MMLGFGILSLSVFVFGVCTSRAAHERGRFDASKEIYATMFDRYNADDDKWRLVVECAMIARGKKGKS